MNADDNAGESPLVAARPRGANGIPEPTDFADPEFALNSEQHSQRLRAVAGRARPSPLTRSGYPEWIAASLVIGGAVAAIVGCSRELAGRSARRAFDTGAQRIEGTKPHGDKLLPQGQHW